MQELRGRAEPIQPSPARPGLFDTRANAINDQGQVVGMSGAALGMHAVLWQPV